MRKLILTILVVLATSPAFAGSDYCAGTINVGVIWTVVDYSHGDHPRGCAFKTNSAIGRRVLKTCPDGSSCILNFPLEDVSYYVDPQHGTVVTKLASVRREMDIPKRMRGDWCVTQESSAGLVLARCPAGAKVHVGRYGYEYDDDECVAAGFEVTLSPNETYVMNAKCRNSNGTHHSNLSFRLDGTGHLVVSLK